jgi:adenylyl-sulfate kinase
MRFAMRSVRDGHCSMSHDLIVSRRAPVFWFTGLSGAGKTTVANGVAVALRARGLVVTILDGDKLRSERHRHLSFSEADIKENNERIAALCEEYRKLSDVILVPIISPYRRSREQARNRLAPHFYEIYFGTPLAIVAARDVKGLYARAFAGEIKNLIGVSPTNPYETPEHFDLLIDISIETEENSIRRLTNFVIVQSGIHVLQSQP